MVDQITANKVEYQDELVDRIEKHFGSEWVYENDNGNPSDQQEGSCPVPQVARLFD
jgi:hypothetical protein